MKKWKLFFSILKERDWLEEMAAQGWILTDITMGILYHFRKAEPCEKVFEIERFAVSPHADVQELNARKMAIDVASQSGWEVVTHDEEMNYYFMKDKAGDWTDEFYDDDEFRKVRAERYRKHYAYETPMMLLEIWLFVSLLYIILFLTPVCSFAENSGLLWIYLILNFVEVACILGSVAWGQYFYNELSLSREEWENRKRFGVKRRFGKVQQLRSFLQEQSEKGLSLIGYDDGTYLFEEDTDRYNYFVDTKVCLKKRLKKQGIRYTDDPKDWNSQSLKWYEMSIADAAQYGLQPVGVIDKTVLIYKRPYSEERLPWENGNESIGWQKLTLYGAVLVIGAFIVGFAVGFFLR